MTVKLPNGWANAKLIDVADILDFEREPINSSERNFRIEGKQESQLYAYYGATGQVGWIDGYRSEGQRILLGEDGAPFLDSSKDKAYLVNGRFWVNNHAHVLQGADGLIDNRFLCYQLNMVDYQPFVSGSTRLKLTNSAMKQIPLVLAPAKEQTRIVEKLEELLSELDAGVAELKAAQKKLVQYRQSLLKVAVEGALSAEWRKTHQPEETGAQLLERILKQRRANWEAKQLAKFQQQGKTPPKGWQDKYPEPVKPDTSDLPALPEGWVWASLDQLTEFITSGSRGWADYYADKGATFIRSQNINKDWLDLSDIAFVNPPRNSEGERTRVEQNDLLLTITGANVGKTALVNVQIEEVYVSQHVALIRLIDTRLSNYLHTFLTALAGGRGQLDKEAYGAGKLGLNLQQVKSVFVPLLPNTERNFLMENLNLQFDAINEQFSHIKHLLKQSTAQRKNILKSAFSGQLVPQDPNDEPASVLLERIRNERQHAKIPAKRPRRRAGEELTR